MKNFNLAFFTSFGASFCASFLVFSFHLPLAAEERSVGPGLLSDTRDYLIAFHENPKRVMNTPLPKRDEKGDFVPLEWRPFDGDSAPARGELLRERNRIRAKICELSERPCEESGKLSSFAGYNEFNQIQRFMYEASFLRNIVEMEKANLLVAKLKTAPWSDSFWPMSKGLIARRWHDRGYPDLPNWQDNFNYVQAVPPWITQPNDMAPAEKYDLLVGDGAFGLTAKMWAEGRKYIDAGKTVPSWAGLCHGWSPASIMAANPLVSVTLQAANGQSVTFFPSDIKALASYAWGETPPKYKSVGRRCNTGNPQEDSVGRVIDPFCFDVNPGTWHMAIVNQLGVSGRSFVFDATFDFQVWNYPIDSYQYTYFNPQTFVESSKLAGSMVKVADFTIDKFKRYRSPEAKYIVGIAMNMQYAVPTRPSERASVKSTFHVVKYVYDLELNADGAIIGGEWYSNFHPDFIWNLPPDGRTASDVEKANPLAWDGRSPLPAELQKAAVESSSKGQVLGVIVDALLKLARPQSTDEGGGGS